MLSVFVCLRLVSYIRYYYWRQISIYLLRWSQLILRLWEIHFSATTYIYFQDGAVMLYHTTAIRAFCCYCYYQLIFNHLLFSTLSPFWKGSTVKKKKKKKEFAPKEKWRNEKQVPVVNVNIPLMWWYVYAVTFPWQFIEKRRLTGYCVH